MLLPDHKALVTGGGSGIGLAVARRMAEEGARVAILDVDQSAAAAVARELDGFALVADVADPVATEKAIAEAWDRLDGISTVVNNAGCGNLAPLEANSPEEFDRLLRVNLSGVFHVLRAVCPRMREGAGGSIVNNASGSGVRPTVGEAPYSAAKAGVIALTSSAAQEYGPKIRVNCVSPGVIRTPLTEPLFRIPHALEPVERAAPLGRAGTADEVADVILFLASDLSRYVTGQNLVVDGGMGLAQAGIDETLRSMLALLTGAHSDS